ncbi:GH12561 [Drosophila grimshawi]|uniref:Lateral signaling target protein 2 homolog n=2 Tax=Drosophila grimshawi TaxID=7222 RepID=B4JJY7_DROGR|nr:GH12561 [Drosophila grimshawi]
MSDGSPPPSICFIRAAESYPKSQMEKEDSQLIVPFKELAGESIKYLGRTDDGVLALSNYRIFLSKKSTAFETYVPLGLIETVQVRDLFQLVVNCKDASTVRCSFPSAEQCLEWQRRVQLLIGVPETLETLFAFPFYSWTCDIIGNKELAQLTNGTGSKPAPAAENPISTQVQAANENLNRLQRAIRYETDFRNEVTRLGFDLKGSWRISTANTDFKLCPSYPQKLLVPCCITDEMLHNIANFRGSRRLPAVVWRHQKSGAILARCSQPEVGWLGWRNYKDEQLLKALADACAFDRGEHARRQAKDTNGETSSSGKSSPSLEDSSHEELALDEIRKILIVDARSYTSAVTNRARGGGCECIEYYPCAEIEFMNLGNIHAIRKSFHAVRQLCASSPDDPNWFGQLEKTMWMQHLSGLLGATMTVVHTIEKNGRPVLVHCSDGWDRTPQIVATAQICLDPFYRTVEGFRVLVEREWLNFGHKFADRSGNGPNSDEVNERCPVFLQWLDLVHQIHKQYPCSFEFSIGYLIKLAQHSLSCLFGTFLCNSLKERIENAVCDRTFSVWPFLAESMYRNPLYKHDIDKVLWPAHSVRFLHFWSDVYLGSLGNQNGTDLPLQSNERQNVHNVNGTTAKTRSTENITTNELSQSTISRRSSDPNLTVDSIVTDGLNVNVSSNSMFDIRSEAKECIIDATRHVIKQDSDSEDMCDSAKLEDDAKNDSTSLLSEQKIEQTPSLVQCDILNDGSLSHNGKITIMRMDAKLNELVELTHCDSPNDQAPSNFESISDNSRTVRQGQDQMDTSTDTLIPIESTRSAQEETAETAEIAETEKANGASKDKDKDRDVPSKPDAGVIPQEKKTEGTCVAHTNKISQSYSNLPRVHIKPNNLRYFQLNANTNANMEKCDTFHQHLDPHIQTESTTNDDSSKETNANVNVIKNPYATMPSVDGSNNGDSLLPSPEHQRFNCLSHNTYANGDESTSCKPTRRNMLWSSLNREQSHSKYTDNTSALHLPAAGLILLPPTPQGSQERPQFNISCPDGLAHGLSEKNIRLHQIVQEHKVREEALLREIHGMRLALLQKGCPSCNSVVSTNVEHENGSDIVENASTCSWEAVEERSGPSSYATSSIQEKKASSVLWVPDYAVSRCSNCQIEFWLGRRKHHCRSCGEIFCADCSEFWAPLPFEKLFNPVRLCGSCYTTVTTQVNECRASADPISNVVEQPSASSHE